MYLRKIPLGVLICSTLAAGSVILVGQTTYTWTGGGGNNMLFAEAGLPNWNPVPEVGFMDTSINGSDADIWVFDGTVALPPVVGQPLTIDVPYGNIGQLIFDNTGGLLPGSLGIAAYPDASQTGTRVLKFNTPDVTVIELTASVTGTVSIGTDRDAYGPMGIRLPATGISTIHVAHPDATLDLSELVDNFSGRGGVHSGSTTQADERGSLRKTGDGTLNLSIRDGQGTRVKHLLMEGGTVIIGKADDLTWATTAPLANAVVIDGAKLVYESTSASSSVVERGFQLGSGNAEIAVTNTGNFTILGGVIGDGHLTKTGTGTLRLSSVDGAYTGGTTIREGELHVGRSQSLGSGDVQLGEAGGSAVGLLFYLGGYNVPNAITIPEGVNGVVTIGGLSTSAFNSIFSGPIEVNSPLTVHSVSPDTNSLRFNGLMSGTADITKTGPGPWRLAGANTWSGNLTIEEGLVIFAAGSELRFVLGDAGVVNSVGGVGSAEFAGTFQIDASGLTEMLGTWQLIDTGDLTVSFLAGFGLSLHDDTQFVDVGGGVFQAGDWTFDTATGVLAVPEPAAVAALLGLGVLTLAMLRRRRNF